MSDQTSDHLTQLEQRMQRQDQTIAQIHEILLLVAQSNQQTQQTLERTARQQEINTQEIAELRSIMRDRYGNGQTPQ
ncbi:MAG: hypothetical protein KME27_11530 [Lyngbya sp. HA4199-MV5]|jgi:uncharacterized membrane protein YjjP (DUF1212 family)|nr:hypothetical protein [Lyngbya sp. HA4199-MV5]